MTEFRAKYSPAGKLALEEAKPNERWADAKLSNSQNFSVWHLERVKAAAEVLQETRIAGPSHGFLSKHSLVKKVIRAIAFALASLIAFAFFVGYLTMIRVRHRSAPLPDNVDRIAAVHGEWSNRTKHVLEAIPKADPPVQAILIVGRQTVCQTMVAAMWSEKLPQLEGLCILTPVSFGAAMAALRDIPALLREGFSAAIAAEHLLGPRGELALSFRVFLGATNGRWWEQQSAGRSVEVLFGCTGTADTTLLERAIQQQAGRTVHLVHGQAIGPNFAGLSDYALFKSKFDADSYDRLGCYKNCDVQMGDRPEVRRGTSEVLLLSNFAHPMNQGFRRSGLTDELNLLACVSRAAKLTMREDVSLIWKPHPVTLDLDTKLLNKLRCSAKALGFRELPSDTSLDKASENARWVICSPSTAAIDLIQIGTLSIVLDPQHTTVGTAISTFPGLDSLQPEALAALMAELDCPDVYEATLDKAYSSIQPAAPLDLSKPLR
tara:strand:+ start:40238 stop:41713 length:1476 start_codon:yes stop_codon:yes gene_type:complete